jgi:DNA-binding transcriptional regulator YiaG
MSSGAPSIGDSQESIAAWLRDATKEQRYDWMMTINCQQIAADIKGLRLRNGLTQAQLAEGLGTKASVISLWESGTYQGYTISTLIRIAAYFDVAFVCRFIGWPGFIVFTANGVMTVPVPFTDDSMPAPTTSAKGS